MNHSSAIFYPEFKSLGVSPLFIAMNGLKSAFALVGILTNLSLVLVTLLSKSLHGSCNLLLALDSFFLFLYCFSPFPALIFSLTGQNFVPLTQCFGLQAVPILAVSMSFGMMLFIAVERLVSISFPVWFSRRNPRLYLAGIIGFCVLTAVYNLYSLYGEQSQKEMVMCSLPDTYRGDPGRQLYIIGLLTICVSLGCYASIWYQMRRSVSKNAKGKANQATRRMFKSLVVIICVMFFGWTVDICVRLLLPLMHLQSRMLLALSYLLSNCSFIAAGASALVLYTFSKDYRAAYNAQLNRLFQWACKPKWHLNSAMDAPTVPTPNQPSNNGAAVEAITKKVVAVGRAAGLRSASFAVGQPTAAVDMPGIVEEAVGLKKMRSISLKEGNLLAATNLRI